MSQVTPNTYDAAFKYWKAVQARLEHTIQDYVDACAGLETALAVPPMTSSYQFRERTFADLDLELPSLPSYEQSLRTARLSLNYKRNSSHTLTPINTLPYEVLLMIFSLANRQWVDQDYVQVGLEVESSVATLSSVCTLWRRLMVRSATFWTDIELFLTGRSRDLHYQRAQLWVERSRNSPLKVSISASGGEEEWEASPRVTDWDISQAVVFLNPLMPRVRALEIQAQNTSNLKFVDEIMASWIRYGTVELVESLEIFVDDESEHLALPGDGSIYDFPNNFYTFLRPLKSLKLLNVSLDLRSLACVGLLELHLGPMNGWSPTTSDIAAVLAASPRLRSLTLLEVHVLPTIVSTSESISLNELEVLTLESDEPIGLWSILQSITSSSNAIRLSISLGRDPESILATQSFVKRCRVTMLHVVMNHNRASAISVVLAQMPFLQTLAIKSFSLPGKTLRDFVHQRTLNAHPLELWPVLREMYLIDCNPTRDTLRQLADLLRPQQALLVHDHYPGHGATMQLLIREQVKEELSRQGITVKWLDEQPGGNDPTDRWSFVHS